eukprot:CAMPEP_0201260260 /NCGR_PEP_ID=MMETSP0853-20130426/4562_1 /ASSEMBLY_ACC=CAM_ASM_000640 /TAXON_ID=183588 /ORGANISM="Pseudo-nitzschia fraudulenta, Strain WWA7" /LENGTH=30 /DNA_ID= /DNA_START= /DNA_END= /DNA_ORIENTATION=
MPLLECDDGNRFGCPLSEAGNRPEPSSKQL